MGKQEKGLNNTTCMTKDSWDSLGFYVYVYRDRKTKDPVYVGKGCGSRAIKHKTPDEFIIEILRYGLTEEQALMVESAAIDLIGLENLPRNTSAGYGSSAGRSFNLLNVSSEISPPVADITHKAVGIIVNKSFNLEMSSAEKYDVTRGRWNLVAAGKEKVLQAEYAFAVYHGVIREVYKITQWLPAGSTEYFTRDLKDPELAASEGRMEFVGTIAESDIQKKYINKSVGRSYGQVLKTYNID